MRDLLTAIILTVVLAVLLSLSAPGAVDSTQPADGYGPQYPGDSGPVLPGGAALPAEASASASDTERQEPPAAPEETQQTTQPVQTAQAVQATTGGNNHMSEMLAFWHGVAAVLIGATAALAVATAWMKIQIHNARHGGAHHKEEMK